MSKIQKSMKTSRRKLFKQLSQWLLAGSALSNAMLRPITAKAAEWQKAAFEAKDSQAVLATLGISNPGPGTQILLDVPEIADGGASVRARIMTTLPGTDWIALLIDKNPQPLAAQFTIPSGTEPDIELLVTLPQTSMLRAVVRAGGKYYTVNKEVKVAVTNTSRY